MLPVPPRRSLLAPTEPLANPIGLEKSEILIGFRAKNSQPHCRCGEHLSSYNILRRSTRLNTNRPPNRASEDGSGTTVVVITIPPKEAHEGPMQVSKMSTEPKGENQGSSTVFTVVRLQADEVKLRSKS